MGVPQILLEIHLSVVTRNLPVTEELLELSAVHPRQRAGFAQWEKPPPVECKSQLFQDFGLDLGRRKSHGIDDVGRYFKDELGHCRSPFSSIVAGSSAPAAG